MGGKTVAEVTCPNSNPVKFAETKDEAPSPEADKTSALEWLRRWREERYSLAPMNVLRMMTRGHLQPENLGLTAEEYSELKIQAT